MDKSSTIIILAIIVVYVLFTLFVNYRITKSLYLDEERRKLHKKIIWILPFIGPLLIVGFWKNSKEEDLKLINKQSRKLDKSNFYESGKGIFGG